VTGVILEAVASEVAYSPFHFHRIFKSIVQEYLNHYIRRARIEKSEVKPTFGLAEPESARLRWHAPLLQRQLAERTKSTACLFLRC
jgi:hypothetical protein